MSWRTKMSDNHAPQHIRWTAGILCGLTIALLAPASGAQAQVSGYGRSSAPITGGTGVAAQPASPFSGMAGTFVPNHKTPDGKACISVHASTHPQALNRKIIEQIVLVNNICGQSIRVQICYSGSSDCITIPMAGYQKAQRTLGISNSTSFRYEYRELF